MADLASDPLAWRPVKAPSLAALEVLAGEVFRALPQGFRELCADLVIQVDDFPSEEVLTEMQAETEFDLLGLFQGVGLPFRSESAAVLAVPAADPGLLGRARRDLGRHRAARAGARDRPPFRPQRRRHGSARTSSR
jgi:hypothetical protein